MSNAAAEVNDNTKVEFLDNNGKLIEPIFCKYFLSKHPLCYSNGAFFDLEGCITSMDKLRQEIYRIISPYVSANTSGRTESIINSLRLEALSDDIRPDEHKIHLKNGTLFIDEDGNSTFLDTKEFCFNRLAVDYNPASPKPETWLKYLSDLLEPEDILTFQEYMGYILVPTTRGQKMLLIIGNGGEGKSRIGVVLRSILEDSMYSGSIQKIETDRFARADLQNKLLMLDDDMKTEALTQTTNLKALVTLEGKIDLERKGKQSEQKLIYSRFMCFGNGNLTALYDRSYGFFRRQIVLNTKDIPPGRVNDPFLGDKLIKEKEGILLWCIEGLSRLIRNNFQFTISSQATENLNDAISEGNNIVQFLKDENYVSFELNTTAASRQIYNAYKTWCADNLYIALSEKTFLGS